MIEEREKLQVEPGAVQIEYWEKFFHREGCQALEEALQGSG